MVVNGELIIKMKMEKNYPFYDAILEKMLGFNK
jgi:hypothetical protein